MSQHLYIAIFAVCFYDMILTLLLPSSATFIVGTDGGAARMICYLASLIIVGHVVCKQGFAKVTNIWIPLLLLFIVFSSFHCPNINFESLFTPKDAGIFNFKPMFECIMYFCLFMAVSSLPISTKDFLKIKKSIALVGIISSIYCILQYLGLDQIYRLTDGMVLSQMTRNPNVGGFMSQPVFAGALLVMCMPFVFKYYIKFSPLLVLSILLTGNRSSMIALAILSLWLFTIRSRKAIFIGSALYASILVFLTALYSVAPMFLHWFNSSGRLAVWNKIIVDFFHPHFPGINACHFLTGYGIGSFSVLFPFYNHSNFYQAHSEPLEIFYTLSIVGFVLFILMMIEIFKQAQNSLLFLSLIAIGICSLTNAVWHIPQLAFMTVFIVALSYNKSIGENHVECTPS